MAFGVAIATVLLVILTQLQQVEAQGKSAVWQKHDSRLVTEPILDFRFWILDLKTFGFNPLVSTMERIQNRKLKILKPPDLSLGSIQNPKSQIQNRLTPDSLLAAAELSESSLPAPQTHPLPTTLAQWQDTTGTGDYFSQIKPTPVGYLVWCRFPIKVYVEQPIDPTESSAEVKRFQDWVDAVLKAVQEWSVYLPLEVVTQQTAADISILRERPPLQASLNRETGKIDLPRARSAETRYQFYLRQAGDAPEKVLSHRFTIRLSPDQAVDYTLATARHELGHALGIWGHSPLETDIMYFSQVRNPPQISARDINTLKRVYEQPTRLGWSLRSAEG
jgi:predicted Zn-dependent protease